MIGSRQQISHQRIPPSPLQQMPFLQRLSRSGFAKTSLIGTLNCVNHCVNPPTLPCPGIACLSPMILVVCRSATATSPLKMWACAANVATTAPTAMNKPLGLLLHLSLGRNLVTGRNEDAFFPLLRCRPVDP
jgi:hypothetical protein